MALSNLSPLDASKLEDLGLVNPKPVPAPDAPDLSDLKTTTDRMVVVSWKSDRGWANPKLVPYGPISLMPTASALQYATECFEGMKLFRGFDGRLRLFRPLYNCQRMLTSATRISLPTFDPEELLKLIHKLCSLEAPKWLPQDRGGSALYIRPTMIGTDSSLGFKVPAEAQLYIFLLYWPAPKPMAAPGSSSPQSGARLLASSELVVRSWPGGTGSAKIGGNYGPTLLEHSKAKAMGYDQVLWLYGPDGYITEAGSTNVFVIWRSTSGSLQIVTPPLDKDGLILAGNTRQSILELSREIFESGGNSSIEPCEVIEDKITINELARAADEGRLFSVFAVGTAFWVQEVRDIGYKGKSIHIGVENVPHVSVLKQKLADIMNGEEDSRWVQIVHEL